MNTKYCISAFKLDSLCHLTVGGMFCLRAPTTGGDGAVFALSARHKLTWDYIVLFLNIALQRQRKNCDKQIKYTDLLQTVAA